MTRDGHLFAGRILYRQPATGFRSGLEPVLLAASVAVRDNQRVLEAGTGAGAALLCLVGRHPGIVAVGVESDPAMANIAEANACLNGFQQIEIVQGPIESVCLTAPFDHVIANPPYHPGDGSASPIAGREIAKRGSSALIAGWVVRLGSLLRGRGSLTLVLPAGMVPSCLAAMAAADCSCSALFPLWPKTGRPAKLVLLRGIKQGRSPMRLMAGLILHQADGTFTNAARSILDGHAALPLEGHISPTLG